MRVAGGMITIISGVFAVLAAIVTLFVGGVGSAFEAVLRCSSASQLSQLYA